MNKNSLSTILALAFLILTAGGYYYIWSNSMSQADSSEMAATVAVSTEVADISGMKDQASKLAVGAENNAGIPIPVPVEKLGNANPFFVPE